MVTYGATSDSKIVKFTIFVFDDVSAPFPQQNSMA